MKILLLSAANNIHTVRWANALSESQNQVILAYNSDHSPGMDLLDKRIKLYRMPFHGRIGYYLNSLKLRKIIKLEKPDIIHVHYASGYGTLARIARIKKYVLSVWGSDVFAFPQKNQLNKLIVTKNLKRASIITSTSTCMANQVEQLIGNSENLVVIPFGVDLDKFSVKRYEKNKHDMITIGNIKTLEPIYGINVLIVAISKLIKSLKQGGYSSLINKLCVNIYGSGSQKDELQRLINNLKLDKIITLKGRVPNEEVPKVLSTFDIFCCTSVFESFGVAIVEALAMELPVVATNNSGFSEIVKHNETGILVEVNNADDIATSLKKVLLDYENYKTLGKEGRNYVEAVYNWEQNVKQMESVYTSLLSSEK